MLTVLCQRLRLLDVFVRFEIILQVFDSKSLKESELAPKNNKQHALFLKKIEKNRSLILIS